ncbi:integrin alpha-X-like [Pleurodeles waltl]
MLIGCNSAIGSPEGTIRDTSCQINHPVFKHGSRVIFVATFDVSQDFSWSEELVIETNATSDNGDQQNPQSKYTGRLPVQYGVNVLLTSMDDNSVHYINFTRKPQDKKKLVKHVYQVENMGRKSLDLEVTFLIPVSIGPSQVWATHGVTPQRGTPESCKDIALTPGSTDIVPGMSKRMTLDCSVVACRKVQCEVRPLQKGDALQFVIEGSVGNTWIPQGPQRKFSLVSAAEITFDRSKYQPSMSFLEAKVVTLIEVYDEFNYLPIILGSSLGGLVLLALISAGLYKAGFFSRRYKHMMEESSTPDGMTPTAPPTTEQ